MTLGVGGIFRLDPTAEIGTRFELDSGGRTQTLARIARNYRNNSTKVSFIETTTRWLLIIDYRLVVDIYAYILLSEW